MASENFSSNRTRHSKKNVENPIKIGARVFEILARNHKTYLCERLKYRKWAELRYDDTSRTPVAKYVLHYKLRMRSAPGFDGK